MKLENVAIQSHNYAIGQYLLRCKPDRKPKNILSTARSSGIKVVYVPHHLTKKGDVADWKFLAPIHQGSLDLTL